MTILIVLAVLVFLAVLYVVGIYNSLVKLRNNRKNAFADIDVQLRQRLDLVPQLVETVKGYAKHESTLLAAVTEARSAALSAGTLGEKLAADGKMASALSGLKVAVEAYPELKANQNFLNLQEELSDIENKLAASRRFFNSATMEYNTRLEQFPANVISGMFRFQSEVFYDLGAGRAAAEEAPKIQF
jgi:LemA protein